MDFVYICRDGDNEELRYSIRSVVSNFPNNIIWVVGGKPDWYGGNFIPVTQSGSKQENARNNLRTVIDTPEISDNFVLMNDDFFITMKIDYLDNIYNGTLQNLINFKRESRASLGYVNLLEATYEALVDAGITEPLNFEVHVPMRMNKDKLDKVIDYPLWRSAYGNIHDVGGREMRDVKVSGDLGNGVPVPFLSTEDDTFHFVKDTLHKMYPNKSRYEVDKK
jgi:hypothetical protein